MRRALVLAVVTLVLTTCGTGGPVPVRQVPGPTPHEVVLIR